MGMLTAIMDVMINSRIATLHYWCETSMFDAYNICSMYLLTFTAEVVLS